jgi:predicted CXXCH cytochrome family protein
LPLAAAFLKQDRESENSFLAGLDRALSSAGIEFAGGNAQWRWLVDADSFWISGDISGPHNFFGQKCETCHQRPFIQVKDAACLGCHKSMTHHSDPSIFKSANFSQVPCASCHKEHVGIEPIVLRHQEFCVSCHSDLKRREPDTKLLDVHDFGTGHPEFRPSVPAGRPDGRLVRVAIGSDPTLKEVSNLIFPHAAHLDKKGIRHPDEGKIVLACADCHTMEPGGSGMLPIRMEEHCNACHLLTFDKSAPDRQLPHGKPKEAVEHMREFYAKVALLGGFSDPLAPPVVQHRRRPGETLDSAESIASLRWALDKAREVATETIGKRACGACHYVSPPGHGTEDGIWGVAPVQVVDRWMLKGRFVHADHQQVECTHCHEAEMSKTSSEILLPKIELCRDCHGGETVADKVRSTCVSCHEFHLPGAPRMQSDLR